MAYPLRIPVWLRWEQEVIYFVTSNIAARQRVLANAPAFAAWQLAINKLTTWTVLVGVTMPEQIQILVASHNRDADVGNFSGALKRRIRQQTRRDWRWQKGTSTGYDATTNLPLRNGPTSAKTRCEPDLVGPKED